MQEAEIAYPPESFGQHVPKNQREELLAVQRTVLDPPALGIAVAESHIAVLAGEDVALGDHAAVQIEPEIDESFLTAADGFAIHHPGLGQADGEAKPARARPSSSLARYTLARALWLNR